MQNDLLANKANKRISLTPLIDVVFILLMFFMLTSSFDRVKSIDLASAAASTAASPDNSKPNIIILHSDGLFSLKAEQGLDKASAEAISTAIDSSQPSIVFPEADTSLQSIVKSLETLKNLGVTALNLGDALEAEDQLTNSSTTNSSTKAAP